MYVMIRGEDTAEAYRALRLRLAELFQDLVELTPDLSQKRPTREGDHPLPIQTNPSH